MSEISTGASLSVEALYKVYTESGFDATPVLTMVKESNNPENKSVLRSFWARLATERVWVGEPGVEGKKQGWAYPEPKDVVRYLDTAKVITIGELGARTSAKSNRVDSVLGLVRMIRACGYTGKIFVKARITDKEVWEAILKEARS